MSVAATTTSSLPSAGVLLRASQIAIDDDRPIMLDYWADSKAKKCCIGVKEGIKYIVKSEQEYTSTIEDIKKVDAFQSIKQKSKNLLFYGIQLLSIIKKSVFN
jgi:hypothetical protein